MGRSERRASSPPARVVRAAADRRHVSADVEPIDEATARMNRSLDTFGVRGTTTHRVDGRSI